jgi:hypothetical protein
VPNEKKLTGWAKIKAWIKDHGRTLPFLGALLVFTTFVVKEGLEANVQAESQTLELATQTFLIRGEIIKELPDLADVEKRVDAARIETQGNAEDKSKAGAQNLATMRLGVKEANVKLSYTKSSIENMDDLLKAFPRESDYAALSTQLDEQRKTNDKLTGNAKDLGQQIDHLADQPSNNHGNDATNTSADLIENQLSRIKAAAGRSDQAVGALSNNARQKAVAIQKWLGERDERYIKISYWVYIAGWGLALFGHIFGVKGAEADV